MYVSGEIQIIPISPEVSMTRYIARVKDIIAGSGLAHTMHDSGTNIQGEYELIAKVAGQCMQAVLDTGAPRVFCYLKLGARTDKDISMEKLAAEK
ncbi:hypothetical protein H4R26_002074, partial [Coemansia thaxteri]